MQKLEIGDEGYAVAMLGYVIYIGLCLTQERNGYIND